jgi:hypothetical protein
MYASITHIASQFYSEEKSIPPLSIFSKTNLYFKFMAQITHSFWLKKAMNFLLKEAIFCTCFQFFEPLIGPFAAFFDLY